MTDQLAVTLARILLCVLFLPFSALDKLLNFNGAVAQARESLAPRPLAVLAILAGLCVEIFMSLGVITGVADRLCAFVLWGYCTVTALLWKRFWQPGDFWSGGRGRDLFWDFLKNLSLGAGFLMIVLGPHGDGLHALLTDPFGSTRS